MRFILLFIVLIGLGACNVSQEEKFSDVNFEYAPREWQTCIGMPDDAQKSIVGKYGQLLYTYKRPYTFHQFNTEIFHQIKEGEEWNRQQLFSSKVPVVITSKSNDGLIIKETAFTLAPPLKQVTDSSKWDVLPGNKRGQIKGAPRNDLVIVKYTNTRKEPVKVSPQLIINTFYNVSFVKNNSLVNLGDIVFINTSEAIEDFNERDSVVLNNEKQYTAKKCLLQLKSFDLAPGASYRFVYQVCIGKQAIKKEVDLQQAEVYLNKAIDYWNNRPFPYGKIVVPDTGVQALINSSIRNIFQAREIKNGLPAYQVGPTCYRGLWIVDGAFLLEAMTFLGEIEDVRRGIEYMMSFQRDNGSFELISEHWKETGIVLWAVTRHAKLTGDRQWLNENWQKLEDAFAYIDTMRQITLDYPGAPNEGLIPAGFSDGGLAIKAPEYTNIYWTMIGMRAAVDAAKWLGKTKIAGQWQEKYESFFELFYKAAQRDMQTDEHGNKYSPVLMEDTVGINPARAQWAFCHAVFPGQIFEKDDPLVKGNMAMLEDSEAEGLVYETGWTDNGVWNYFGSFYSHAWLWIGKPQKAVDAMYAMANHASPTLVWREEQTVKDAETFVPCGDMPHNWASAEFIRNIRHLVALERNDELHLLEGLPKEWTAAGMVTKLNDIYTTFGILDLEFTIDNSRSKAVVKIDLETSGHIKLNKIIVHNDLWNAGQENLALAPDFPLEKEIKLVKN